MHSRNILYEIYIINFTILIQHFIVTYYIHHIISAALNTIIDRKKLSDFEQLSSLNEKQLNEIANLVCGLRLYNVDQSTCKEEILDST